MTVALEEKRTTSFDYCGWVYTVSAVEPGLARVVTELTSGPFEVATIDVGDEGRPTSYSWASPFCSDHDDRPQWRETMKMLIEKLAVLTLREAKAVNNDDR